MSLGNFCISGLTIWPVQCPSNFSKGRIFSDLTQDCVEIYMDDFTMYGDDYEQALANLDKVLTRCQETNLALSNEKCKMLMIEGIVLGHHISATGMKVDPAKIEVITKLPPTQS